MQGRAALTGAQAIRLARAGDWPDIREICWLTGGLAQAGVADAGARELFGRIWIEPYERLLRDWAWVAESDGRVQGYLTACPRTADFQRRRWWRSRLPLAARIACLGYARGGSPEARLEAWRLVRRTLGLERSPDELFAPALRQRLAREYPAHLHVNVRPDAQRSGQGGLLVQACLARLRAEGVGGLHLYCGPGPAGFYRRQGLEVLGELKLPSGWPVHAMGIRL